MASSQRDLEEEICCHQQLSSSSTRISTLTALESPKGNDSHHRGQWPFERIVDTYSQRNHEGPFLKQEVVRVESVVQSPFSSTPREVQCVLAGNGVAAWREDMCSSPVVLEDQIREEGEYLLRIQVTTRTTDKTLDSECGSQGELEGVEDRLSVSSSWIVDRTPPNTEITQVNCIECPKKRFAFTATDVWAVNKFQCRTDGSEWTLCSSPREIQVQANGESHHALPARHLGRWSWKSCLQSQSRRQHRRVTRTGEGCAIPNGNRKTRSETKLLAAGGNV